MKLWIDEKNQRCCDRATAIELGGQKYANTNIKILYHFDEFIQIVDEDSASTEGKANE